MESIYIYFREKSRLISHVTLHERGGEEEKKDEGRTNVSDSVRPVHRLPKLVHPVVSKTANALVGFGARLLLVIVGERVFPSTTVDRALMLLRDGVALSIAAALTGAVEGERRADIVGEVLGDDVAESEEERGDKSRSESKKSLLLEGDEVESEDEEGG